MGWEIVGEERRVGVLTKTKNQWKTLSKRYLSTLVRKHISKYHGKHSVLDYPAEVDNVAPRKHVIKWKL